jgi:hypothetical protein
MLLEYCWKKKGVPPFTSFTKGKEMSFNYFYDHDHDHERERERCITYQANIQFIGGRPPDTCGRMMTIASKPNGSFISFSFASFFHALYNFFLC